MSREKFHPIGCHVLIQKEDKFLVIKRSSDSKAFPNMWDLPGGGTDYGEQPYETALREVKEEVQLDVEILDIIDIHSLNYTDVWVSAVILHAKYSSGKVSLSDEHTEFRWLDLQELRELKPRRDTIEYLFKSKFFDIEKL